MLDDFNRWLAPLLSDATPRWIEARSTFKENDLIIAVRYSLQFISSSFCGRAGVAFVVKKDIKVTPSFCCDIHWNKVEYFKDEGDRKKKTPVDTSSRVDVYSMEVGHTPPIPTH
ncbi:hypothetical protein RDI58_019879 [Solanum bulbocastanum]|uniref:Uncharacterized protein n=1 Tax=Solanum bulbocastanum TaxID=147425 RepID=A0AAN8YA43_SOLBU